MSRSWRRPIVSSPEVSTWFSVSAAAAAEESKFKRVLATLGGGQNGDSDHNESQAKHAKCQWKNVPEQVKQIEFDRNNAAQEELAECQWKIVSEQMNQICCLVESLEALRQEVSTIKGEHDLGEANRIMALNGQFTNMEQRILNIEKVIGESVAMHDKHAQQLDHAHKKVDNIALRQHGTIETRLQNLEKLAAATTENHTKEHKALHLKIQETELKLAQVHGTTKGAKNELENHHLVVSRSLHEFEKQLGTWAEKHRLHNQDVEVIKRKLGDWDSRMKSVQALGEQHHASVTQRLEVLYQFVEQLGSRLDLFSNSMTSEKSNREETHVAMEQRVAHMEQILRDSADLHASADDLRVVHDFAAEVHASLKDGTSVQEKRNAFIEQRIELLEAKVHDSLGAKHNQELNVVAGLIQEYVQLTDRVSAAAKDLKEESAAFTSSQKICKAITSGISSHGQSRPSSVPPVKISSRRPTLAEQLRTTALPPQTSHGLAHPSWDAVAPQIDAAASKPNLRLHLRRTSKRAEMVAGQVDNDLGVDAR